MTSNDNKLEELQQLYEKAGSESQQLALPLLDNAVFMRDELEKLMDTIKAEGWTTEYWNGKNQRGIIESAAGKAYHKLIKDFNTTIKSLQTVLNDKIPEPEDEFESWTSKK